MSWLLPVWVIALETFRLCREFPRLIDEGLSGMTAIVPISHNDLLRPLDDVSDMIKPALLEAWTKRSDYPDVPLSVPPRVDGEIVECDGITVRVLQAYMLAIDSEVIRFDVRFA